jgi:hypothetical protein
MSFNKNNPIDVIKVRPRFKLYSVLQEKDVIEHLLVQIEEDNSVIGKKRLNRVDLSAPQNELHYWSPELHITIEENEDEVGTCLYCLLGPQQNIWLTFVGIYSIIGLVTFFGGMYALAKLQLGNPSYWLLLFPLAFILVLGVYLISYFGKKKGHKQSLHLLRFLYSALEGAEIIRK